MITIHDINIILMQNNFGSVGTLGGLRLLPSPMLKAGYADGWYKVTDKCVMNIERNRFQTYLYKQFASELAQIYFFEVDVLLLAYKVNNVIYLSIKATITVREMH